MNEKLEELLSNLSCAAYVDSNIEEQEARDEIERYLESVEFIAEVIGIKKHDDGKWVHPLVGVIDGIDECKTDSDVVCRLLEVKHGPHGGAYWTEVVEDALDDPDCSVVLCRKKVFTCHYCNYKFPGLSNVANCPKCGQSIF